MIENPNLIFSTGLQWKSHSGHPYLDVLGNILTTTKNVWVKTTKRNAINIREVSCKQEKANTTTSVVKLGQVGRWCNMRLEAATSRTQTHDCVACLWCHTVVSGPRELRIAFMSSMSTSLASCRVCKSSLSISSETRASLRPTQKIGLHFGCHISCRVNVIWGFKQRLTLVPFTKRSPFYGVG